MREVNRQEFGRFLRRLRLARGLQQKQVAESLGLTPPQLSDYENGRVVPSALVFIALLRHYGRDLENLIE